MKSIFNIFEQFKSNKISKSKYIKKIHKYHQLLFDYSKLITSTDIKKIEITANKVIMEFKQNNIRIVCDPVDERDIPIEIINFGTFEGEYNTIFLLIAKQCKTFVDIGANTGWYSLNVAKVNPKNRIYSFEPISKAYDLLLENIQINKLNNVLPMNIGLSNNVGRAIFYYHDEGPGNASLKNLSKKRKQNHISCTLDTLDNVVKKNNIVVDLIKCDVEGNELNVFKGAINTLTNHQPVVFAEMVRKWTKEFNYHPNEIIKLFEDCNYSCFYIKNKQINNIRVITDNTRETNFIFFHNNKHKAFISKYTK